MIVHSPSHPYPPPSSPQSPRGRPSPFRLRRRAHAWAVAAQAASNHVHADEEPVTQKTDMSVQTEKLTVDATVQVDCHEENPCPQPPESTPDQHQHLFQAPAAAEAGHEHRQAVVHVVGEETQQEQHFNFYSDQRIPQLDGKVSSVCSKCNECQKTLESMDDYSWHFKTEHGREDCRILRSMLNL